MTRLTFTSAFLCLGLSLTGPLTALADMAVPEQFQRFDPNSKYTINYADLNTLLKKLVVDVGRSDREKAEPVQAKTGTRMKANVKRSTINEGNRFAYEVFGGDEESQQVLLTIQKNLEALPGEAPLEYFSRDEQLAYWLNLYNVTLINQIIKVYPERKLKKLLTGKNSILEQKLLNVAGVPLSLNDIQYGILKKNYDNNPLVIYGLYQGIIGGPNIRKSPYTGANVQRNLEDNASEFINSNRGTYPKNESVFRASSLYERNRGFFRDFQPDLKKHLLVYLQGPERRDLQSASTIKPDISDWTVTDLYGSYPEIGGSFADSSAALLDATVTTTVDDQGNIIAAPNFANSDRVIGKSSPVSYVSPELITYLREIKLKQDQYNQEHGTVTVEELGEVPTDAEEAPAPESDEQENNQ